MKPQGTQAWYIAVVIDTIQRLSNKVRKTLKWLYILFITLVHSHIYLSMKFQLHSFNPSKCSTFLYYIIGKGGNSWRNSPQQHSNFGRYLTPNDICSTSVVVSSRTDEQATHWRELFSNQPFLESHEQFKVEISCHLYPCAAKVGPMLMRWTRGLLTHPEAGQIFCQT